jgi:PAS domain S-box-containing protein
MEQRERAPVPCADDVAAAPERRRAGACPAPPFWAQRLGPVLEAIGDLVLVFDVEWRFVYLNPRALRETGEPLEALLGRVLWEKYPALCGTETERQYRRAMGEQRPAHFETLSSGSGRWYEIHAYPSPEGLTVCGRDISERKAVEAELRESEQRHRIIAELSTDYAYVCDVADDGSIRMTTATEGFTRLTGYTPAEVNARGGVFSFVHPDDVPDADEMTRRLTPGANLVDETRIITKDGQIRWVRYSLRALTEATSPTVRLIGAVQDITERKQAELALRASEEKLRDFAGRLQTLSRRLLEVQEQERRALARELHDEVGQMLTGLHLSLELARRRPPGDVHEDLDRARELIRDLMARVRGLSQGLRPTVLDDLGLVPALERHFDRYTDLTAVRVAFEHQGLERRCPAAVETAAYRIIQESLTNVSRHAHTTDAAVRVRLEGGMLFLEVADEGVGFDAAVVAADGRSTGLSGMQERATLLGGRLRAESAPGLGTRVLAELPVEPRGGGTRNDTERAAG